MPSIRVNRLIVAGITVGGGGDTWEALVLGDSPWAWYRLNDTVLTDLATIHEENNAYPATMHSSGLAAPASVPGLLPGSPNKAVLFDGLEGISTPLDTTNFSVHNPFTVEFALELDTYPDPSLFTPAGDHSYMGVWSFMSNNTTGTHPWGAQCNITRDVSSGELALVFGVSWQLDLSGTGFSIPFVIGQKVLVGCRFDGTYSRFFVNGTCVGVAKGIPDDPQAGTNLKISGSFTGGALKGMLDEVVVYKSAVPASRLGRRAAVFGLGNSFSFRDAVKATNPVAYWPLNDEPGSLTAADLSGANRDATVSGPLVFGGAGCLLGQRDSFGADFDVGGAGQQISATYPALCPTNGITVAGFMRQDVFDAGLPFMWHAAGGVQFTGDSPTSAKVSLVVDTGAGGAIVSTPICSPPDGYKLANFFHWFVCTYDRSHLKLYIDGVEVASIAETRPVYYNATTQTFYLGYQTFKMQSVAIWDRGLTPTEIADIWNAGISFRPTNTSVPTISGAPTVGSVLTCNPGTWDSSPAQQSSSYVWERSPDGTTWTPIFGPSVDPHYTPVSGDVGKYLRCNVFRWNQAGLNNHYTAATAAVS